MTNFTHDVAAFVLPVSASFAAIAAAFVAFTVRREAAAAVAVVRPQSADLMGTTRGSAAASSASPTARRTSRSLEDPLGEPPPTRHLEAADPDTGNRGLRVCPGPITWGNAPARPDLHELEARGDPAEREGGDRTMSVLTELTTTLGSQPASIDWIETSTPCRSYDPELWFAERPAEVAHAQALCGECSLRAACLAGAL